MTDDTYGAECQIVIDEAMARAGVEADTDDPVTVRSEAIRILAMRVVDYNRRSEWQEQQISAGYVRREPLD